MASLKVQSSTKRKRMISHSLTYLYLLILSVIILFPLMVTVSSAFKVGNVTAFTLDLKSQFSLENFRRLFHETLYVRWYLNTLWVAVWTMLIQVLVVTLTGYAYSRYNFVGRKKSLIFFLIIQMVPTTASLTAFFVMAWLFHALNEYWFLIMIYAVSYTHLTLPTKRIV